MGCEITNDAKISSFNFHLFENCLTKKKECISTLEIKVKMHITRGKKISVVTMNYGYTINVITGI